MRTSRWSILTLGALSFGLGMSPVSAQDDRAPGTSSFRPFVSAGFSQFVGDFGEGNHFATGPTIRGGVQTPGSAVALGLSYWSDVNRFRLVSLQLEFYQDLTARHRITPNLFGAVGHTWRRYLGTGTASGLGGTSGAFGLGVEAIVSPRVLIAADARLRSDGGGWNGEWRLAGELTSSRPLDRVQSRQTSVVTSWMTSLGGPWVTVEPGWGLLVVRDRGVLAVHLVHWRIPNGNPLGTWDTRGLIATAQSQISLIGDHLRLRIGPAVTAMGEGPDDGINYGGLTDLVLGLDLGSMRVETTAGWLFVRRPSDSGPSHQSGLIWTVALGL